MTDRAPPKIENAPGLVLIQRLKGWTAKWQARRDLVGRGWRPTKLFISIVSLEPTDAERAYISDTCTRMQSEMLMFGRGGIPVATAFDGTIRTLVNCYQTDEVSPYRKIRYKTRVNYDGLMRRIVRDHGDEPIRDIKRRTILLWYEKWRESGIPTSHSLMTMMRIVIGFGSSILEDSECVRLRILLHDMKFENGQAREDIVTAEQATAIRAEAHKRGLHSIALAQAIQFECTFRQKDVIGEWVPQDDPVLSDICDDRHYIKWARGLVWQKIDANLILRHVTSKKNKPIVIRLKNAPMVMEEFDLLDERKSNGPVIICEKTGKPWRAHQFRRMWRDIARACGIPDTVQNRDTRAGAITEATDSGASLEDVRHTATHSNVSQTAAYSRNPEEKTAKVMQLRASKRNGNGTRTE